MTVLPAPADPASRRQRRRQLTAVLAATTARAALPASRSRRERARVCVAAALLTAVGIRVEVHAPAVAWPRPGTGRLVVANRASALDELVLATVVRGGAVVHPERTSGPALGRFRPEAFRPAVDADQPVCPVAVHWRTDPGGRPCAGPRGTTARAALEHALTLRALVVEVHLLPPLAPAGAGPEVLAALAEYAVAAVLEARAPGSVPRPQRPPVPSSSVPLDAIRSSRGAPTVWRRRRVAGR